MSAQEPRRPAPVESRYPELREWALRVMRRVEREREQRERQGDAA